MLIVITVKEIYRIQGKCDGMFDVILSGSDTPDHVVMKCLM